MKLTIKITAALLAIIMPLLIVVCICLAIEPMYSKTFVGELDEKFDRLTEIDEPKVVVVGGSSVAFGLQSELLEKYTGMPVVNFGLYAALGTKVMLDLSRAGIGEGDIVILSPELDAETFSLFFNPECVLQATDDDPSMLLYVDKSDYPSLAASMFSHAAAKIKYLNEGAPDPDSVYNSKNFNSYGDIEYERSENIMELYYDPNKTVSLDESIISDDFIDYLNDYIAFCERRGAKVFFSYCPINSLALARGTSEESILAFDALLRERLECEVIGYIEDYIMEPGYFYDSNFHLNDPGALARTITLCEDILFATDNPTLVVEEYPEVPELDDGMIRVYESIEGGEYFTYERLPNGNYMITGLTELGLAQRELTLPLGVAIEGLDYGAAITILGAGALSGAEVERLIIPENTYLTQMNNGSFEGASKLTELYIYKLDSETLNPPGNFSGCAEGFTIHAPEGSEYTTGYFWSQVKNVTIKLDIPN